MKRIVDICAVGIGNRARKYLEYALAHPDRARVCAVVDTDPYRLAEARARYSVPAANCFSDVDAFLLSGIRADGVIVATGDDTHFSISEKVLGAGFNLLLEKPMAENISQCRQLVDLADRTGLVTSMCYVMRYHPYYSRIRDIVAAGELGDVLSIRHRVNIGIDRMTHTFVRGLWARKEESSPIFISKCCHDMDFIFWIAGKALSESVLRISSDGGLTRYRPESAPAGASERCLDCPLEESCRYSAVDLYRRRKEWISNFEVPAGKTIDDAIEAELENGRYGRCVYHCGNDVFDWQNVSICSESGLSVDIAMDGIIDRDGRETEIEFSDGRLVADGGVIALMRKDGSVLRTEDYRAICARPLHAGADIAIVEDFCDAVRNGTASRCSLHDALPGLEACFRAEGVL